MSFTDPAVFRPTPIPGLWARVEDRLECCVVCCKFVITTRSSGDICPTCHQLDINQQDLTWDLVHDQHDHHAGVDLTMTEDEYQRIITTRRKELWDLEVMSN